LVKYRAKPHCGAVGRSEQEVGISVHGEGCSPVANRGPVLLRYPEQVADDRHRQWKRQVGDDLAGRTIDVDPVEQALDSVLDDRPEALSGPVAERGAEQGPHPGVLWRVERGHRTRNRGVRAGRNAPHRSGGCGPCQQWVVVVARIAQK
jgi:hypothetical protein